MKYQILRGYKIWEWKDTFLATVEELLIKNGLIIYYKKAYNSQNAPVFSGLIHILRWVVNLWTWVSAHANSHEAVKSIKSNCSY